MNAVHAGLAVDVVVALVAQEVVAALAAADGVVAALATNRVIAISADDHVVAGSAVEHHAARWHEQGRLQVQHPPEAIREELEVAPRSRPDRGEIAHLGQRDRKGSSTPRFRYARRRHGHRHRRHRQSQSRTSDHSASSPPVSPGRHGASPSLADPVAHPKDAPSPDLVRVSGVRLTCPVDPVSPANA